MSTSLTTKANPYRRVLATNTTASAFTARVDLLAMPAAPAGESTTGYVYVGDTNTVLIKLYGTDADNETGSVRVYGLKAIERPGNATSFTHVLLGEYAFTLSSTLTGVAGGVVGASEFYADTITRTYGLENVADQVFTPTSDEPAHILVDRKGHDVLLVEPIVVTALSVNALIAGV
jgi:hypothetical protein